MPEVEQKILNTTVALVVIASATLGAGIYIGTLVANVEKVEEAQTSDIPGLVEAVARVEGALKEAEKVMGRVEEGVKETRSAVSDVPGVADVVGRVESTLKEARDAVGRIEGGVGEARSAVSDVLGVAEAVGRVEDGLKETRSAVVRLERGIREVQSSARISFDLEEHVSKHLASATSNTAYIYVFKHTFDFPNPGFDVPTDAKILACPRAEVDVDREARDWEKRYREALDTFKDNIEFRFYTTTNDPPPLIRQEVECYKHSAGEDDDLRISPAPVKVSMQLESALDDGPNYGRFVAGPRDLGFDHEEQRDMVSYPLRTPYRSGRQAHVLTATLADRERRQRGNCRDYRVKAATGDLDRCDLHVFLLAYGEPTPLQ